MRVTLLGNSPITRNGRVFFGIESNPGGRDDDPRPIGRCQLPRAGGEGAGKLVFGMMQSLDGYVCGGAELPGLGVGLHRYFNDSVGGLGGGLYEGAYMR